MFSRSKKPTVKKSAIVEETPLFAQLLPFASRMNDKVQLVNALAFTFIMGFSIFGIALWETIRADLNILFLQSINF